MRGAVTVALIGVRGENCWLLATNTFACLIGCLLGSTAARPPSTSLESVPRSRFQVPVGLRAFTQAHVVVPSCMSQLLPWHV